MIAPPPAEGGGPQQEGAFAALPGEGAHAVVNDSRVLKAGSAPPEATVSPTLTMCFLPSAHGLRSNVPRLHYAGWLGRVKREAHGGWAVPALLEAHPTTE